jgi:hypothetical protein
MSALTLGGCVSPPLEPRTVLDERSGASVTVVDAPLVLARERRDVAAHARDYLTLVAAEINEAGRRRVVWVAHQWSTIDKRATDFQPAPGAPLLLIADGRDLRLAPVEFAGAAMLARNGALLAPDDTDAITTFYSVDPATLEYVATSHFLSASFPESRLALPFTEWRNGRAALKRFLARVGNVN